MRARPAGPGRSRQLPAGEIRRLTAVARTWLAGAILTGLGQAVLLVAQASVLAGLLAGAMHHGATAPIAVRDSLQVAVLALGQGLLGWAWEACTEAAARRARAATRRRAVAGAVRLSAARSAAHDRETGARQAGELGPGGMTTLLGSGMDELEPFVGAVLPRTVLALAVPAMLLAWIGHLDLASAGLAAGALALAPLLAGLVGADTAVVVRRRLAALERLGDRFAALVQGLPLLRAFGRDEDHERAVAACGEEVRAATLATLRIALLAGLVLELLAAVGTALVAIRLGLRLDAGQRILPQALAVLILTPEVFLPLRRLTADFHAGATGRAVLGRVSRLTSTEPLPSNQASPEPDNREEVTAPAAHDRPEPVAVVLEQVCLTAGGERTVLDDIDVQVGAGERLCLVGESGAGKTSLLRVVAGLARPSAGRVRLDGLDPAGGSPALGWVPQDPTVLAATVLDNVALGRPGVDEDAVRAALQAAQLGPWLSSLPLGLDTPLSGLGAPLSLGERRRLAVARCLAGPRPQLWLLDEPTAGLDQASAGQLVSQLSRTLDGATAIIATHDPLAMTLGQRTVELCHGHIRGPAQPAAAAQLPGRSRAALLRAR